MYLVFVDSLANKPEQFTKAKDAWQLHDDMTDAGRKVWVEETC
jgi:hypothetical protein